MLSLEAVRRLVAYAWVAAGFPFHLGLTLDNAEVCLLARLGGWEPRANRPLLAHQFTSGSQEHSPFTWQARALAAE